MFHGAPRCPEQQSRRRRLQNAHPQIKIVFLGSAWQAVIPRPAGEDVITRYELRDLLDVLEERLMAT
jgi:hypothetical protein